MNRKTDQQYQKRLEQYNAFIEQTRRAVLAWLEREGKVQRGAEWSDKVEDLIVALMG